MAETKDEQLDIVKRTEDLEHDLNRLEAQQQEELKRAADELERRSTTVIAQPAPRPNPVMDALVKAQPSWIKSPPPINFGNKENYLPPRPTFGPPTITRSTTSSPDDSSVNQITDEQISSVPDISFLMSDASETDPDTNEVTNKVAIVDGKVTSNGSSAFPVGMGGGDFVIDLNNPEDALIYVLVTFNPTTLATTSVTIGESTSGDLPESRVESDTEGFLVFLLGYTFFDGDGDFTVHNRRVGDISYELVYGQENGRPAMLPVPTDIGWIDLEALLS